MAYSVQSQQSFLPVFLKQTEIYAIANIVLTFPSLMIVFRACMISRMASATVSIQIHRLTDSSHTNSYSMFSLIIILIASKIEDYLFIELTELFIDMQS